MNPESNSKITRKDRVEIGRQSYREGHSFEERVAELYRLLRYEVEHGRLFSGRQVDLFLKGKFGDLTVFRAIECKAGPVNAQHIDSFIIKLRLVRRDYPSVQGTIVSSVSFSDAVTSQAAHEGIQLTIFRDLAAQLFDGHYYVNSLIRDCETNERYPFRLFIEPYIGYESSRDSESSFSIVTEWLKDSFWKQMTLLGDVGTGKSFLSRMISYRLAKDFLDNPLDNPVPILIDLRNADRQFSLEGLVLTHLANNGLSQTSFEVFQHALSEGKIVLILDGFDEMAARVTPIVTKRNFYELSRCVKGEAKVLLTCRTHYFKSRTEEEEVVLGKGADYESDSARELYWDLISRKGFNICYLRPFEPSQIEEYVERAIPANAKSAIQKIRSTYNLMELSQRPMLLEMIVKSINKLSASEINPTTLYQVYTDAWIHRDQWRDVLSPEEKISFLQSLSNSLWQEETQNIHHTKLENYLQQDLASQIQNNLQFIEIDNEIRTASFLTRDEFGNYGFAHKSYLEYFFALFISDSLNSGSSDCLHTKRFTPEVITFLNNMLDLNKVEIVLEDLLCNEYRPLVSENALLCLYGFRRMAELKKQKDNDRASKKLKILLPKQMKLSGAKLNQVSLEGAILQYADLREANLSQTILKNSDMSNSFLAGANLEKADLINCSLRSADMANTILVSANMEKADLTNSRLHGSNLTDAYLLDAIVKNSDFNNVIATRSVLPEEIVSTIKKSVDDESLRSELDKANRSLTDKYWNLIKELRPNMIKAALAVSIANNFDAEDIVTEAAIQMARPETIDKIFKLNKYHRKAYIMGAIKNVARDKYGRGMRTKMYLFSEIFDSEMDIDEFENSLYSMIDFDEFSNLEPDIERVSVTEIENILPQNFWNIVKLKYIDGLTLKDISSIEGKSISTIHRYLRKALEIIRNNFSDDLE